MNIEQMELKYKVRIRDDSFYDPWSGQMKKRYKVYDASGECWDKGLSYKSLRKELAEHKGFFARVAEDEAKHTRYVVYCYCGGVEHKLWEFGTEREAVEMCESYDWEYDWNGGLMWYMRVEEEKF